MGQDRRHLTIHDISFWFISLGLATDTNFVKKIMKALAPKKFEENEIDKVKISVNEFSHLFQIDLQN